MERLISVVKIFRVSQLNNFLSRRTMATKLDSPQFKSLFCPELESLSQLFGNNNYELRIAGGAVRDLLQNKTPADIDLATTATPEQMKKMFNDAGVRMLNVKGEEHGTITARINDKENYEVTTLRIDKVTDGRHAEVEFTTDWLVDANRRDLTINSMFLGLDGIVYDFFNGRQDLEERKVRFVGDSVQRIQEDYLRILRYFRFYGRISQEENAHDEDTIEAIKQNVEGMARISGERIWTEWKKILIGRFGGDLTSRMVEVGLGPHIGLPTNPNVTELKSVCNKALENNVELQSASLLASLLNSQEDVMALHGRLKLSGFERDLCLFIVTHREDKPDPKPLRPYQWLEVDSKRQKDTRQFIEEVLKYRGDLELLELYREWEAPKFPVTGHHLKEGGCPPGKLMSVVMGKLKEKWKMADFQIELDDLLKAIPEVLEDVDVTKFQDRSKKGKKKDKALFI